MNGLLEILTNKVWMVLPSFVHGILPTLMYNSQNHTLLGINLQKRRPMAMSMAGDDILREYEVTQDGTVLPTYDNWNDIDYLKQLQVPFVNIMPITGPITRNGGACSYGSKDIRDWMMKAADNKYCRAHIFISNTPGGSAWAKNDFQMGIDYAHSKGQRVYDLIDGLCASAGEYKSALCDEVYVVNLMDQLGCIGVMASFFTQKNGEKNQYTGETYREYYATKSVNKNKEMRDIAEDDDATLLIEELDRLEAEFRADMKAAFPKATDEHLDGKMFNAKDVMGILCDGQMMLGDLVARAFAVADGTEKPIERTSNRKIGKLPEIDVKSARVKGVNVAARNAKNMLNPNNNTINMKEKFPAVFALLEVEEMQMSEGGAFLNEGLLQTLNAAIEAKNQEIADAKKLADDLTAERDNLNAQIKIINDEHAAALTEKDNAISALEQEKADLQADVNAKADTIEGQKAQIEQLQADVDGARTSLATAEGTIQERDQQITDLNGQIEELQNNAGAQPNAGAAPDNNGGGAEAPEVTISTQYVMDPALSYDENMRRKKEFEASRK